MPHRHCWATSRLQKLYPFRRWSHEAMGRAMTLLTKKNGHSEDRLKRIWRSWQVVNNTSEWYICYWFSFHSISMSNLFVLGTIELVVAMKKGCNTLPPLHHQKPPHHKVWPLWSSEETRHTWCLLALWKSQTLDKGLWMMVQHMVHVHHRRHHSPSSPLRQIPHLAIGERYGRWDWILSFCKTRASDKMPTLSYQIKILWCRNPTLWPWSIASPSKTDDVLRMTDPLTEAQAAEIPSYASNKNLIPMYSTWQLTWNDDPHMQALLWISSKDCTRLT